MLLVVSTEIEMPLASHQKYNLAVTLLLSLQLLLWLDLEQFCRQDQGMLTEPGNGTHAALS